MARCECGTERAVQLKSVKCGDSKSCGCQRPRSLRYISEGVFLCPVCKKDCDVSEFRQKARGDRIEVNISSCRSCDNQKRMLRYRQNIRSRVSSIFNAAKARAATKNIPFDIDVDYLISIFEDQKEKCYYTGRLFKLTTDKFSPSIDRKTPSLGYTKGNIVWCCRYVNTAKSDLTDTEFLALCQTVSAIRTA